MLDQHQEYAYYLNPSTVFLCESVQRVQVMQIVVRGSVGCGTCRGTQKTTAKYVAPENCGHRPNKNVFMKSFT